VPTQYLGILLLERLASRIPGREGSGVLLGANDQNVLEPARISKGKETRRVILSSSIPPKPSKMIHLLLEKGRMGGERTNF